MRGKRRPTREPVTIAQKAAWREVLRDMVVHEDNGDQSQASIVARFVEADTEEHMLMNWLRVYGMTRVFRKGRRADQLWYIPTIKGVVFAGYPPDMAKRLVNVWIDKNRHWLKTSDNKKVVFGGEERSYRLGPRSSHSHYSINRSRMLRLRREALEEDDD